MSHFNPLNTELNPICHFLALLGAHHILHVSRIRVKITEANHAHVHRFKTWKENFRPISLIQICSLISNANDTNALPIMPTSGVYVTDLIV
jgi:hypothetical protein